MRVSWPKVGEWAYIIIFCLTYILMANIQSRMFPVNGTMAQEMRASTRAEIDRITRELAREDCEQMAIGSMGVNENIVIIWYYDENRYEYWCGLLDLDALTGKRAEELKPFATVLNSDRNIRRILDANNKHKRK